MKYLDDTGLSYFWNKLKAKIASITHNDIAPVYSKEYTNIIGTANDQPGATFFFANVRPTTFYAPYFVKYRITADVTTQNNFKQYSEVEYYGSQTTLNYKIFNEYYSTSYRCYYYNTVAKLTSAGYTAGYSHVLGVDMRSAKNPTSSSYKRKYTIEILETKNCTVEMFDTMKKTSELPGTVDTHYTIVELNGYTQGLQETGDANDNTIPSGYCTTATATAAKVASCSNYSIANKSFLQVIMQYANTAEEALTLNVNSKGAKPIYINGVISSATNFDLPAGSYITTYLEDSREPNGAYYFRTDGKLSASITGDCSSAEMVNGHTVEKDVPSDAKFTDTTYQSKTAASGGTDVSLVTTGEKYTWNNKGTSNLTLGTTSSTAYRGDYGNTAYSHATDSSRLTTAKAKGLYKVASTAEGHIADLTAVQKSDITALGIPSTNTYTSAYCTTAAATAAKVASCSDYYRRVDSYIHIIMANGNSAAGELTLNINNTGVKPIAINGNPSSSSNYSLSAGSYIVYFDGNYYQFRTDNKLPANISGDARTVTGHYVDSDVPMNAVFTDTTYESKAAASGGTDVSLVTTGEKYNWNRLTTDLLNKLTYIGTSTAVSGTYTTAAWGEGTATNCTWTAPRDGKYIVYAYFKNHDDNNNQGKVYKQFQLRGTATREVANPILYQVGTGSTSSTDTSNAAIMGIQGSTFVTATTGQTIEPYIHTPVANIVWDVKIVGVYIG